MVDEMRADWQVSIRRACEVIRFDPRNYLCKSRRPGQAALEQRIREICQTRVRFSYWRVHVLLRREGWEINAKDTDMGLCGGRDAGLLASGETTDNAFIEALNGRFRAECLNSHWFMSLEDAAE